MPVFLMAGCTSWQRGHIFYDRTAEAAIRQTKKKRAAKRNNAIKAAAEAGVTAVLDNCVDQTRSNILSNFDNAVTLTRAAMKDKVKENKNPQSEADEIKEEVLNTLKDNEAYRLREIKVGSDNVPSTKPQTQVARNSFDAVQQHLHS